MRLRLVGVLALGGVSLAVLEDGTACDRHRSVVERSDEATFEEARRAQAVALAECMAEQARTSRS